MDALTSWDIALLIIAVYVAVLTLVRLMARYRDQLLSELRRQIEDEKRRRGAAKKKTAGAQDKGRDSAGRRAA